MHKNIETNYNIIGHYSFLGLPDGCIVEFNGRKFGTSINIHFELNGSYKGRKFYRSYFAFEDFVRERGVLETLNEFVNEYWVKRIDEIDKQLLESSSKKLLQSQLCLF